MQVRRGQGDGRKCIPPAGFHADAHTLPQLVVDGGHLGLAGGKGHRGLRVCRFDLTVDTLQHGFVGVIRGGIGIWLFENFDKLFGPYVIGQGP